jgi:crossover junction endodeoxyribonuclease RusA
MERNEDDRAGSIEPDDCQAGVNLPWPPRELSPNARKHWAVVAKHKKLYRQICALMVKQSGMQPTESMRVFLTFYKPSNRRMDLDNCLASMKSGLDGVADALGIDDKHFKLTVTMADELGGYVKLELK